ncbi:unnamed protein product [Schistosoma mattheei]|uniref:Uncharacterized protein n=1 Tax=Schistosoma mattheei TaxID=31246 RepID=A0A183PI36_9TREM|nr:unnamed protein product [Schistosoma mattheei]
MDMKLILVRKDNVRRFRDYLKHGIEPMRPRKRNGSKQSKQSQQHLRGLQGRHSVRSHSLKLPYEKQNLLASNHCI